MIYKTVKILKYCKQTTKKRMLQAFNWNKQKSIMISTESLFSYIQEFLLIFKSQIIDKDNSEMDATSDKEFKQMTRMINEIK
jgi:hypothetical protein